MKYPIVYDDCIKRKKLQEDIYGKNAPLISDDMNNIWYELLERLNYIATQEEVCATPKIIEAIVGTAKGDMRKAVNTLQSIHLYYGDTLTHFGSGMYSSKSLFYQYIHTYIYIYISIAYVSLSQSQSQS